MASSFVKSAKKGVGRGSLDLPLAGLAGLSAGFVTFSLPPDLLEALVGATGIGNVLAAAQPPLGGTARIALAVAAAIGAFLIVFLMLRLLDRRPAPRREPDEMEAEPEQPRRRRIVEEDAEEPQPAGVRLRRWDAHPDAPARRPIFAVSEIGEPEPVKSPLVAKPQKAAEEARAPFWRPDDFPAVDHEEAESWFDAQESDEQPVELAAPEPEPEPAPEPAAPEPAAEQPPAALEPKPEPIAGNESIAELMARLERGISRGDRRPMAQPAPEPEIEPEPESEPVPAAAAFESPADDRLKSAIDSLQRIASRGI